MDMIRRILLSSLLFALAFAPVANAEDEERYVVLVTIDGLRWEELFRGADPSLVTDAQYRARYVDVPNRALALAPFLLSFADAGALIGNRDQGSCARVENTFWFSYPGYAEMLAGRPNPAIRYNAPIPNEDVTVLERLAQAGLSVRVFAEWDVALAILNTERSGLQVFVPPNPNLPHDPQVMSAAREIFRDPPRVAWIALGDTDNRAHEGLYEQYLAAATDADNFLRELWDAYQANPNTAGRTTLIVTTDHGRGRAANDRWEGHGSGRWRHIIVPGLRREGSDAIFMAVRGPGPIAAPGYTMEACATLSQTAATLLAASGRLDDLGQPGMAAPLLRD